MAPAAVGPRTSTLNSGFNTAWYSGLQIPKWPLETALEYKVLLRRFIPENELVFILDILSLLKTRVIIGLYSVFCCVGMQSPGCCTLPHCCLYSTTACTHPPQSSLTSVTTLASLVLPLSTTLSPLCSSVFPTSSLETPVCHIVSYFNVQRAAHANIHCQQLLVCF